MALRLKDFFSKAVAAQLSVAGNQYTVARPKTNESYTVDMVLTSRDGSTTADAGGIIVTVSGHALIPITTTYEPKIGDRITGDNEKYMVVSVIRSTDDAAWSCDLVSVQK